MSELVAFEPMVSALQLPEEYQVLAQEAFGEAALQYTGTFRSITFKGNRFHINDGGVEIPHNRLDLDVVFLRAAPKYHHVWYKNKWQEGTEERPDAIWFRGEQPPAGVPEEALVKDEAGRNKYQFVQRTVVALVTYDANGNPYVDTSKPYVMDLKGSSIFGEQDQMGGMPYAKLNQFVAGHKLVLCGFITKAYFLAGTSVPVLRFLPQGSAFQGPLLQQVFEAVSSQEVKDLCVVTPCKPTDKIVAEEVAQQQPGVDPFLAQAAMVQAPAQAQPEMGIADAPPFAAQPQAPVMPQAPVQQPEPVAPAAAPVNAGSDLDALLNSLKGA